MNRDTVSSDAMHRNLDSRADGALRQTWGVSVAPRLDIDR